MFYFEKIFERDIDLIIMRSLAYMPEFAELFLKRTDWSSAKIVSVEHSLMHPELGESDITVIVEFNGIKYALLIENKIDAENMPDQYGRYVKRGELGIKNGEYIDFVVFITAPQEYLYTNQEALKYPQRISYETMLEFFERRGFAFEKEALSAAVAKKESGYTVQEVRSITKFWEALYAYVQTTNCGVEMKPNHGAKGAKSLWVYFDTPIRNTYLIYKSDQGTVELEFSGKLSEKDRLQADLFAYKDDDMHWKAAGKSLALYTEVKKIDFNNPFEQYIEDVNEMLSKVKRLKEFALMINDIGYAI